MSPTSTHWQVGKLYVRGSLHEWGGVFRLSPSVRLGVAPKMETEDLEAVIIGHYSQRDGWKARRLLIVFEVCSGLRGSSA